MKSHIWNVYNGNFALMIEATSLRDTFLYDNDQQKEYWRMKQKSKHCLT